MTRPPWGEHHYRDKKANDGKAGRGEDDRQPDALLTDERMPGMTGCDLAWQVR